MTFFLKYYLPKIFGLVVFAFVIIEIWRRRRLRRKNKIVEGRVLAIEENQDIFSKYDSVAKIEFLYGV